MIKKLRSQLILHEGIRLKPYKCPAGKWTIGVGRNIEDKGISEREAMFMLDNDIQECAEDLEKIFPDFRVLSDDRRCALIDLRFNLGPAGFRSFENMIAAVKDGDFETAAAELKDSHWWGQVQAARRNTIYQQLLRKE